MTAYRNPSGRATGPVSLIYLQREPARPRESCFKCRPGEQTTPLVPDHNVCEVHHGASGPCTRYVGGHYCGFRQGDAA